jgi:hypothetical protein
MDQIDEPSAFSRIFTWQRIPTQGPVERNDITMSRSPQLFDRRQAAYHLRTVVPAQRINPGYVAIAYKLILPSNYPHVPFGDFMARGEGPDRYFWSEGGMFPTISAALDDIDATLSTAYSIADDAKIKVMFGVSRYKDSTKGRSRANVHSARFVHLDYDGQHTGPMSREHKKQLASLRPLFVQSGSPDSFHAYIGLGVGAMNPADMDRLSRTLRLHFNCDAKASPNDVMGLAGTINLKNGRQVKLYPAARYDFDRRTKYPEPKRWQNIFDVTEHLGIEMAPAQEFPPMFRRGAWEEPKARVLNDVPTPTRKFLMRKIRDWTDAHSGDTSTANFYIARMCAEKKLTPDQAYIFMTTKLDPRNIKFREAKLYEDICNIYRKSSASR